MTSVVYLKQPYAGVVKSFIVHTDASSQPEHGQSCQVEWQTMRGLSHCRTCHTTHLMQWALFHVLQAQPHLDYVCLELLQHCLSGGIVGDEEQ